MMKVSKILKQAAGIFFVIMLVPAYVIPQEQTPSQQQAPTEEQQLIIPQNEAAALKEEQKEPIREAQQPMEAEEPAAAQTGSKQYAIKKGDTLWDLSNSFLRDPFLWPFIWKANLSITNPDLIYPGNILVIPDLAVIERALKAQEPATEKPPVEKKVEKKVVLEEKPEPKAREGIASAEVIKPRPAAEVATEETSTASRLILPEEQPVPIIDKYAMLSAGFINTHDRFGEIEGSTEDLKTGFGFGDMVYVSIPKQNVSVGDKFLIYTPLETVKHPDTGKRLGRLIRGLGILQITKINADVSTAKITLSFDSIAKGALLTPYQEPALVFNPKQRSAKDLSGYIVEVTDNRTITGTLDFVYLDKGSADGVEPGDQFLVYAKSKDRSFPRKLIGEVQVFIVKPNTSTAVVRRSSQALEIGNQIDYKK